MQLFVKIGWDVSVYQSLISARQDIFSFFPFMWIKCGRWYFSERLDIWPKIRIFEFVWFSAIDSFGHSIENFWNFWHGLYIRFLASVSKIRILWPYIWASGKISSSAFNSEGVNNGKEEFRRQLKFVYKIQFALDILFLNLIGSR